MDTSEAFSDEGGGNDKSKKAATDNGFYNVVDDGRVCSRKGLSISGPRTGKQLVVIPYVQDAFLNKAISDARNAFAGWVAVPFGRRKAILARLLNKMGKHVDELSTLLTAEQGGTLVQARWEIDLLSKEFGPALMQMEVHEKESGAQHMQHITKRYIPIEDGTISLWNLPVILSFGKVLPALLAGHTVVLRPLAVNPLTVLRISELICPLLPSGVFNVVIGGQDLLPWMTTHSGIDLIAFTRSANIRRPVVKSAAGTLKPYRVELVGSDSRMVAHGDAERAVAFGSIRACAYYLGGRTVWISQNAFRNSVVSANEYESSGLGLEFG
jgi:acyl-CoA reductase-like NAD-dependent aldehyde dehydrogenase